MNLIATLNCDIFCVVKDSETTVSQTFKNINKSFFFWNHYLIGDGFISLFSGSLINCYFLILSLRQI